jgi:hypothetical protein
LGFQEAQYSISTRGLLLLEAMEIAEVPIQGEPQGFEHKISSQCEIDSIPVSSFEELGSDLWGSP